MNGQLNLFDRKDWWEEFWAGMPPIDQQDQTSLQSINVHFKTAEDREAFAKLIGQTVTSRTRAIWYPRAEIGHFVGKSFETKDRILPRFPIYIVSKGRYETRLTSDSLDDMGIPHFIIVEKQEEDLYRARVRPTASVIVLDPKFQADYDTFSEIGASFGKGSGPARNFAWDHAVKSGTDRHWVVDDNINGFFRLYRNLKTPCNTGAFFRHMEDFCLRYENIAMAGPNYFMFASRKDQIPPFVPNTRIYSCNLIKNDIPFRWRGRYNEDTDLSLRILKSGLCTILFNAFLQMKTTTLKMGGGNTDTIYKAGTLPKSQMLVDMHPDVARLAFKFNRWHHFVNYKPFRCNKLIPKKNISDIYQDYGMKLIQAQG